MKLHELKASESKRRRKRVGRGDGSDKGRTCGRGDKGQMSRAGANHRPHFEGGQIPLFRRLPKRGFTSLIHKSFNVINVGTLNELFSDNDVVDIESLKEKGVINKRKRPLKILADGEISKPLTVKADKFSKVAKEKIASAGGTCEVVG